jgi:hypothetical protein
VSQFLTTLDCRETDEFGGLWTLLAPLAYDSEIVGGIITVPAGFVTDFASVPRYLPIAYAAEAGKGNKAAVVHDSTSRALILAAHSRIFLAVFGLPAASNSRASLSSSREHCGAFIPQSCGCGFERVAMRLGGRAGVFDRAHRQANEGF